MGTLGTQGSRVAGNNILGWLGLGRGTDSPANGEALPTADLGQRVREHLLDQIAGFLLDNQLEVTAANLTVAHGVFAGLNPGLKRRIQRRLDEGEPITQGWLDKATATETTNEDDAIEQLADKLEQNIDQFSASTRSARTATTLYGDALEHHVGQLEAAPEAGEVIANLTSYARAMLERSRKAEAELRDRESEAAKLRRNLDRARRDAEVDFLTGLPNRRAFEALLEKEFREAQAALEQLSVAFCDIDHFKAVNDNHGHEAGDRILRVVAETLAKISDDRCHIARHGGEEFVMLFRGLKPQEALARLDSAREQLAARKLVNRKSDKPFGQITFSGGVADAFAYDSPREALAAADAALYEAKEGGRNQVRLAGEPVAGQP